EHAVAALERFLVALADRFLERKDLFVLLVEVLAELEELARRDASGLRARSEFGSNVFELLLEARDVLLGALGGSSGLLGRAAHRFEIFLEPTIVAREAIVLFGEMRTALLELRAPCVGAGRLFFESCELGRIDRGRSVLRSDRVR